MREGAARDAAREGQGRCRRAASVALQEAAGGTTTRGWRVCAAGIEVARRELLGPAGRVVSCRQPTDADQLSHGGSRCSRRRGRASRRRARFQNSCLASGGRGLVEVQVEAEAEGTARAGDEACCEESSSL